MSVVDMFLKLDGIDGESKDADHQKEIDILSWSWAATNSAGSGGGAAGSVHAGDVVITKRVDNATVPLKKAVLTHRKIPSATITNRKAGDAPIEYLKLELSDVYVTSIDMMGSSDIIPQEVVKLNFAEIRTTYSIQKSDGSAGPKVTGGWNAKTNQAL